MQPLSAESILIRQILDTDRRAIGTCVRVSTLHNLRLQVFVAQVLYKSLRLSLLSIARSVSISEAAVVRKFVVVACDRHLVPIDAVLKLLLLRLVVLVLLVLQQRLLMELLGLGLLDGLVEEFLGGLKWLLQLLLLLRLLNANLLRGRRRWPWILGLGQGSGIATVQRLNSRLIVVLSMMLLILVVMVLLLLLILLVLVIIFVALVIAVELLVLILILAVVLLLRQSKHRPGYCRGQVQDHYPVGGPPLGKCKLNGKRRGVIFKDSLIPLILLYRCHDEHLDWLLVTRGSVLRISRISRSISRPLFHRNGS